MPELLTIAQQLLPTLLLLAIGLVVAHLLAIAITRSRWSNRRRIGHMVRMGAIALALVLVVHQVYTVGTPSVAVVTYSEKHWQKGAQGWANVAVGGGGYVTGVYLHPRQKDLVYIRTDIGGIYRWNPKQQTWMPLTEHFPMAQHNYYGGEGVALDPKDANVIYLAAGKYLPSQGAIFKSVNQGKTWTKLSLELPMGGNEGKRWAGERLVVNPFDSKVVLFGSRQDGLWRSSDAGKTWNQVEDFAAKPEKEVGINSIAFDSQQTGIVYASAYGDGVYRSTDAGKTWSKLKDSPGKVNRLSVAKDGTLYTAGSADPKVSQYRDGKWRDITPSQTKSIFNGLAVNPNRAEQVMVSYGETPKTEIYLSNNGGKSWNKLNRQIDRVVPWAQDDQFSLPWIADLAFDPYYPNRAWLTDWAGVWRTDNVTANSVQWQNLPNGHEEVLVIDLVAPPSGALLVSGMGDVDGFYHDRGLDEFPSRKLGLADAKRGYHFTYDIDYTETDPRHMVRIGSRSHSDYKQGATSSDGGKTWKQFGSFPKGARPTRIAMSATDPNKLVVTVRESETLSSSDRGKTWKAVAGLPASGKEPRFVTQTLASDRVDGDTFYVYLKNELYRSVDGGVTFKEVNDRFPKSKWQVLKALPGKEGDVWLGLDNQGLHHSTDGGKTFSKVSGVDRAYLFAFGKPPENSKTPALYLYGTIAGQGDGIFRSLNLGQTWVKITDSRNTVGNRPMVMEASRQVYGLVFVGTNGRGIYYRHTGNIQS